MNSFWQKIKERYRWRNWHAYLIFALVPLLMYGHSVFFDYTYLDDQRLIMESADILQRADPAEIFLNDVFFGAAKFYYRPILTWSFALDWHIGGGSLKVFHISNLFYHIVAVWLLFNLLQRARIRRTVAFWLAFFFAIHPALTQAVVWIPGRNDILTAIFIFSTLIFLSRWFRAEKGRDLGFSWLFFLLALLTKETSALLPFLALGWVWLYERPFFSWLKLGLAAAGATAGGIIWYLLRAAVLNGESSAIFDSLLSNLFSPVVYLGKSILPFNLSVYPVPADTTWLYGIAATLMIGALLIMARPWKWQRLIYGLLWFWPLLVLGSSRPDSDLYRNFMEHRLYVPIFGLLLILGESEGYWYRLNVEWRRRLLGLGVIILLLLAWQHSGNFRNRLAFWEHAAKTSPHSPLVQRNLGAMYYLDGDAIAAEYRYREALRLNPQEPMAHNNLAAIYIDREDWWRAEIELKRELEVNPGYDVAYFNLGRVYYHKRRYSEAARLWQETLRVNPRHTEAARMLDQLKQE
ncbi:hypothetical protein CVU83_02200 [Candidatus Falkowbacteria bacterium HGW-Falkowbacteria-2]|uniref:Uncharacterized protein n=1 Tax=Candidatus Falkowbacteria bacterium HGW-Falkowbacteria-2 TaxID=2013769 RepID=A0A2N2E036_9BACT|nr:MAG: hypothetical protein CVU83_02200 [Candidatus Falkowbacteria bacterium HGW-Falkowbacteria-2]